MELDPDELHAAARRWDALAEDLVAAAARARSAPASDPAVRPLLDAAADAVGQLARDVDRLVDGLWGTTRAVAEVDRQVGEALRGR